MTENSALQVQKWSWEKKIKVNPRKAEKRYNEEETLAKVEKQNQ